MSSIEDRIIDTPDGGLRLLGKRPAHGVETVMTHDGTIMRRAKSAAGATFSANGKIKPQPLDSTVCTRAEAATIFGRSIEETARLLDLNDVGKHLAYDRQHVEAIADALKAGRKSGAVERVGIGQPLVLDPLPDP